MSLPSAFFRWTFGFGLFIGLFSLAGATELDKGHHILLERGIQSLALVDPNAPFHLETLRDAGFTAAIWTWKSVPAALGPAPGFPWARWASGPDDMPKKIPAEAPYLPSLIAVQFADEQNLTDPAVRQRVTQWLESARADYPNAMLYCNNLAFQASPEFIKTARPDMLSFDRYPFRSNQNNWESLRGYYGDLMIFRSLALAAGIPYGMYTQTFKADELGQIP